MNVDSLHNLAKHLQTVHRLAMELHGQRRPDWDNLNPEDQRAWIAVALEACRLGDVIAATGRRILTPPVAAAKSGGGGGQGPRS